MSIWYSFVLFSYNALRQTAKTNQTIRKQNNALKVCNAACKHSLFQCHAPGSRVWVKRVLPIFYDLYCIREPTKIVRKFLEDGTKVRVSKKSGHVIPKPDFKQFLQPPVTCTLRVYVISYLCLYSTRTQRYATGGHARCNIYGV